MTSHGHDSGVRPSHLRSPPLLARSAAITCSQVSACGSIASCTPGCASGRGASATIPQSHGRKTETAASESGGSSPYLLGAVQLVQSPARAAAGDAPVPQPRRPRPPPPARRSGCATRGHAVENDVVGAQPEQGVVPALVLLSVQQDLAVTAVRLTSQASVT